MEKEEEGEEGEEEEVVVVVEESVDDCRSRRNRQGREWSRQEHLDEGEEEGRDSNVNTESAHGNGAHAHR
jgi:hypothetical protein